MIEKIDIGIIGTGLLWMVLGFLNADKPVDLGSVFYLSGWALILLKGSK